MVTKERVLESLKDLPDEFSIDELVERLIFIQQVENGLAQAERGEVLTTEEMKAKLSRWSK